MACQKDDGAFDFMAGATITPRAVIKAVHQSLEYFEANKAYLFASKTIGEQATSAEQTNSNNTQ